MPVSVVSLVVIIVLAAPGHAVSPRLYPRSFVGDEHAAAPPQARLQRLADALVRPFAPAGPADDVSSACRQHSEKYLRALAKLDPWAMHMYDASAKIPSSVMAGNIQQMGNFDQCVSIRVTDAEIGADEFSGKHCTASVAFAMPDAEARGKSSIADLLLAAANASGVAPGRRSATYDWAFCVPSTCTAADVQKALKARLTPLLGYAATASTRISVDERRCTAAGRQHQPLQPEDIAFICLLLATMCLVVASSLYDVLSNPKTQSLSRLQSALVAFSVPRNATELLSPGRAGRDVMACMHGLRVLSISWVVLLHSAYMDATAPNVNQAVIPKLGDSWSNMVVLNATLATDTFFLLSGTLLAIGVLRSEAFNPVAFYWHRYVRLTPVYAVVVWFYVSLLPRLGAGPRWERTVGTEADNCARNWWANLAYINNYVNIAAPCMSQTWFLAVDMQLFCVSPLVLLPVRWWPRAGRALLLVLLLASVAVPFAITFSERLAGAMLYTLDQSMLGAVFVRVYVPTYTRAGPYLLGIALGCALSELRGKPGEDHRPIRVPRAVAAVAWAASTATCLAVLFGVAGFYQPARPYSALEAAAYAGLHRSAWAAGVAWVIFACVQGCGGPVNALLSWRPFAPLARLSYCVYLVHFAVILVGHGLRRTPGYFSSYFVVHGALGTMVLSLAISVVLSLAFEMPFMALDRVFLPRGAVPAKSVPAERAPTTCTAVITDTGPPCLRGYDNAAFESLSEK